MEIKDLSQAQCILLAVHLASESNVAALHSFTPTRPEVFDPELVLRILLTYLPESIEPAKYTKYVQEVVSRLYLDVDREDVAVDTTPVADVTDEQAQRRVKKLHLLQIRPPGFPPGAPDDLLTRFICHRAARIDSETGMLSLLPTLIEPHLNRNDYIRTWYISVVFPLIRHHLEYYPDHEALDVSVGALESIEGSEGIDLLLNKATQTYSDTAPSNVARDIRGLVGPWMYGHTERKRRKLGHNYKPEERKSSLGSLDEGVRKIALTGVGEEDKTGHDWEYMYRWMVQHAIDNIKLVASAIDNWDGPGDVDLGGFERGSVQYLDEEIQIKLELQYAQAAFAACYAAKTDSEETVRRAHEILARLAILLDFIPPPDLATSVESLPLVERHIARHKEDGEIPSLSPGNLLAPDHPLTTPKIDTYMLLQMMVYSAYQLCNLGLPSSLAKVAKLAFTGTTEEQMEMLRSILRKVKHSTDGQGDTRVAADRAKLLWLWNWGIKLDDDLSDQGLGILGRIPREKFEQEMLKTFVETNNSALAIKVYITDDPQPLPLATVERIIFDQAMKAYDGASNGNKNRGGVKRANDIISTWRPHFPDSTSFREVTALIAATHALSFYSLTLQHGVPFQPVSIRVSHDPVSLISKVLEQNPRSYAKLDDLVSIAQNLVSSGVAKHDDDEEDATSSHDVAVKRKEAGRRVTFMAIEAALREDDFETAYSYIVSRLSPSGAISPNTSQNGQNGKHLGHVKRSSQARNNIEDDISWRAAFLAGRYRPSSATAPSVRRLEQRTELLSLALLLAPTSALTEILAAWRRCEEEMTAQQASQQASEDAFDDQADRRLPSAFPGDFTVAGGDQPALLLNQKRREMGRLGHAADDAPLSMFDLTRNAARALSSNAFPLAGSSGRASLDHSRESLGSDVPSSLSAANQDRLRKRDLVANAVSGGLASGLGWVLGATPVNQQQQQ